MSHGHQCEQQHIALDETRPVRSFSGMLAAVISTFIMWLAVGRTRAQLGNLTEEQLADIGISREAAERESVQPFWIYRERPRD